MERTVTKLTPSGKIKDRYYLDFDSGESLTVTINQIADYSIFTGRVLSDEEFEALSGDAEKVSARSRALRMLGHRPMSRKEVTDRLCDKGTEETTAEETADWLESIGALNDGEYACQIVRHYSAKGYGTGRIRDELYKRGVPRDLWDDALNKKPDSEETVYRLLKSKIKSENPDRAEITKAANALYRRGFSWDEIKRAVNKFETEENSW